MNSVRAFWLMLALLIAMPAWAYELRVVSIPSDAMRRSFDATVVLPDQYARGAAGERFPVVYLLHGSGGDYSDWSENSRIARLADRYRVILVMPDGGRESWYIDSPFDPRSRYETYVGTEVVRYIDGHFRTIAKRDARAITGLSMGGFGALHLALDLPERFGAAGSISGAVDPRGSRDEPGIEQVFGDPARDAGFWNSEAIVENARGFSRAHIALTIDCGVNDSLVQSNRALHERLVELGVPHDYTERPGGHTWQYWSNAVRYQVLFFADAFRHARAASSALAGTPQNGAGDASSSDATGGDAISSAIGEDANGADAGNGGAGRNGAPHESDAAAI